MNFIFGLVPLIVFGLIHSSSAQVAGPQGDISPMKLKIDAKLLPPVTQWIEDTAGKVQARSEAALKEGPAALEKLARQLQTDELKDQDGRYTTPYFFKTISESGEPIGNEERSDYQKRIFSEWRKQFPGSEAAILAEARLYLTLAFDAQVHGAGVADIDQKWEVVERCCKQSLKLLKQCEDLQKSDPAWWVVYFALIDRVGIERAEFDKMSARMLAAFPDGAFPLSRAAFYLFSNAHGKPGEWEPWLRERLKTLPEEAAAKMYARTYNEIIVHRGFEAVKFGVRVDRGLMMRGLDLLAKEYPASAAMACMDAGISARLLDDRRRTLEAFKRANGRIDLDLLSSKAGYEYVVHLMTSAPWVPEKVGLPTITGQRSGSFPEIDRRIEAAAKAGPKALEALISRFRSEERFDQDGEYLSTQFFNWFEMKPKSLADLKVCREKAKLLEDWRREYPASPFAQLASACYGLDAAWDARGMAYAPQVAKSQWKRFAERLESARKYLAASQELQETEPMWSAAAFTLLMGENATRQEFEKVADELFAHFPECDLAVGNAIYSLRPRWGGEPGEWVPWLREKLKDQPEDVRARAYARAMIGVSGYALDSSEHKKEIFGDQKPDLNLLRQGLKLLREKYPDSLRIANGEAALFSDVDENPKAAFAAMKRMNGTLDMNVWYSNDAYDGAVRWVTWKNSK